MYVCFFPLLLRLLSSLPAPSDLYLFSSCFSFLLLLLLLIVRLSSASVSETRLHCPHQRRRRVKIKQPWRRRLRDGEENVTVEDPTSTLTFHPPPLDAARRDESTMSDAPTLALTSLGWSALVFCIVYRQSWADFTCQSYAPRSWLHKPSVV